MTPGMTFEIASAEQLTWGLIFVPTPDTKEVKKNRLHLDFRPRRPAGRGFETVSPGGGRAEWGRWAKDSPIVGGSWPNGG